MLARSIYSKMGRGVLRPSRVLATPHALQERQFISVVEKYSRAVKEFGVKGTLWKLYFLGDVKFGKLVGEDRYGTKYYEDLSEPYGQHRWAEPKFAFEDWDPSMIPPEWHVWIHHMRDELPSDQKPGYYENRPIVEFSDAPYNNNLGLMQNEYKPNLTTHRSRGYGVGSLKTKWGEPDREYLQPNHPLRRRKRVHDNVKHWKPNGQSDTTPDEPLRDLEKL